MLGESEGEEAGAAVGIYEVVAAGGCGLLGGVVCEGGEDGGVVLEEVAGEEVEFEVADLFSDDGFWFGFYFAF